MNDSYRFYIWKGLLTLKLWLKQPRIIPLPSNQVPFCCAPVVKERNTLLNRLRAKEGGRNLLWPSKDPTGPSSVSRRVRGYSQQCVLICVADLLAWCWLAEQGMTSSLWRQGRWSIRMQRRAAEPLSIVSTKHMPFQLLTRSLCVDNRDRRFNPLTSTHTTIILQILILQIMQTGCYGFEIGLSMSVLLLLTKTELLQIIFIW